MRRDRCLTRTPGGRLMRPDITPGGMFPDYELPDHSRTARRLSELQGDDPLILTLARGHYCPKEHQQHLELAAFYSKVAVAYTKIATIATDEHHALQEFRASVGAQWPFLSDPGRIVQQDLDIQEYTDPDNDPMIPHTLVLKPGLVVHSIYNGYWFWRRPSVLDLWHDLRAVTREIRPDWDLSAPGLRDAWDAGDFAPFHGWDRGRGSQRDVRGRQQREQTRSSGHAGQYQSIDGGPHEHRQHRYVGSDPGSGDHRHEARGRDAARLRCRSGQALLREPRVADGHRPGRQRRLPAGADDAAALTVLDPFREGAHGDGARLT